MRNKAVILIFGVLLFLALTGCFNGSESLTAGKTPQEIVSQAYDKFSMLDNYEVSFAAQMNLTGQNASYMSMTGKITVFINPMKIRIDINSRNSKGEDIHMEEYMEKESQQTICYKNINGQWHKYIVSGSAAGETVSADPRNNLKLFVENLSNAEIIGREENGDQNIMKLQLSAPGKIFGQVLKNSLTDSSLGIDSGLVTDDILSGIGDVQYVLWIDEATLDIVSCQLDLTDNLHKFGEALAGNKITEGFKNMEMSLRYSIFNQNSSQDFTIPEEAKNAKEI